MWSGHFAIIFALKGSAIKDRLAWVPLILVTLVMDILSTVFLVLDLEVFNPEDFQSIYSHSFFTAIGLGILLFMAFSLFMEDKKAAGVYALMPMAHLLMDLLVYPQVFFFWNQTSIVKGANGYAWLGSVYLFFAIELGVTIAMYLFFRFKNPIGVDTTQANISSPEKKPEITTQPVAPQTTTPPASPQTAPQSMPKSKLKLGKNDFIVLALLVLGLLPVLF